MFYKLLAMLLVVAGLVWIGVDQTTLLVVSLLLVINNILAWLIKFAFMPSQKEPAYLIDRENQNRLTI